MSATVALLSLHGKGLETSNHLENGESQVVNEGWPDPSISKDDQGESAISYSLMPYGQTDIGLLANSNNPTIPNFLTRPVSAHEDLAAGFSFTKAQPLQSFDFTRRPKEPPTALGHEVAPSLSPKAKEFAASENPQKPVLTTTATVLNIPFPKIPIQASIGSEHRPTEPASGSSHGAAQTAAAPRASPVIRKRRKPTATNSNNRPTSSPTQQQLAQLLMIRSNEAQRELEALRAAEQGHNEELKHHKDWTRDLQAQLEDKEAELSRLTAVKPRWERRLKKLNDYVKGLTAEHDRLRDDAIGLKEQSNTTMKEKEALLDMLQELRQNTAQQHEKSMQNVAEARQVLEMREQTIQNQQSELHALQQHLLAETERNARLGEEISTFTANHGRLAEDFAGYCSTITERLNNILNQSKDILTNTCPESRDDSTRMLKRCTALLEMLQNASTAKPEDLDRLDRSMRDYLQEIAGSVDACKQNTAATETDVQRLATLIQEQNNTLSKLISETGLSKQVVDLHGEKVALREQLYATNANLDEARSQAVALQEKDQDRCHKVGSLKAQVAQLEHEMGEQRVAITAGESNLRNKDEEIRKVRENLINAEGQLQEACRQTQILREEKLEFETQALQHCKDMEAVSAELDALKSEHLDQIRQFRIRKSPDEKLTNATKQCIMLKSEKDIIEKQATQLRLSLDEMQKERQNETAFVARLSARLAELEEQVSDKDVLLSRLHTGLQGTIADNDVQDGHIRRLQERQEKSHIVVEDSQQATERHPHLSPLRSTSSSHNPNPSMVVVEESQSTNYTRSMTPIDLKDDTQPITEDDLKDLFPVTPAARTRTLEASLSQNRLTSCQIIDRCEPLKEQRKTVPRLLSNRKSSDQRHAVTSFQSSDQGSSAAPFRRLRQDPARMPRGILKVTSTIAKREASVAELNDSEGMGAHKRRKASTAGLGPVIEDSQPQSQLSRVRGRSVRGRISSVKTSRKNTKDDQMNRRFSQELRRSVDP